MASRFCAQCGRYADDYRTFIGLQRGSFAARYVLDVCWPCFEVFITMAHSSSTSWRRVPAGVQVKLPLAAAT